jgi:hypothetical protein
VETALPPKGGNALKVFNPIWQRIEEPGSALQLGIFRALIGLQVFYASSTKAFEYWQYIGEFMNTRTWLPASAEIFIAEHLVTFLQMTTQASALFVILGLGTRYALPICTIAFLLLFSYFYRSFNAPVQWLYLWFPLVVLSFSKCAEKFSLDSALPKQASQSGAQFYYQWPLEMVIAWLSYIYVAAGIAKIVPLSFFLPWLEGGTSKGIMYARFLDSPLYFIFGKPLFNYADEYWLYAILTAGSVIVELSAVLLLFGRIYYLPVISAIVIMHWFLYLTGVAGFSQTALILAFAFLPAKWFQKNER